MRRQPNVEAAFREYTMGQAKLLAGHAGLSIGLSAVNFRLDAIHTELRAGFEKMNARLDGVMTVLDHLTCESRENRSGGKGRK